MPGDGEKLYVRRPRLLENAQGLRSERSARPWRAQHLENDAERPGHIAFLQSRRGCLGERASIGRKSIVALLGCHTRLIARSSEAPQQSQQQNRHRRDGNPVTTSELKRAIPEAVTARQ